MQGDQKVSVHLMITIQKAGAQRLFDHRVHRGLDKTDFGTSPFPVLFQKKKKDNFFSGCFQKTQYLFYSDHDVTNEKRKKKCSFYKTYSKLMVYKEQNHISTFIFKLSYKSRVINYI